MIAQRAMKQMTGYFGGYISKRQKVGQFELKQSVAALPLYKVKLAERKSSAASALALFTNRLFTTLEGKGILRSGVEETLLAAEYNPRDELAAEFIRTFQQSLFFGQAYLQRLDQLRKKVDVQFEKCLPKKGRDATTVDHVSLYGLRPADKSCFYMSPWEFTQWWRPIRLQHPSSSYRYTRWKPDCDKTNAEPGVDYEVDIEVCKHSHVRNTIMEP